eukprot:TRINITY_DN44338_c0_g1_i1.p1 TRINITY_DN44338_c0_g1~~TRINITY_DN44338_c0_g1_i1.p1  ORF type:complete len:278 (+),score=33.66 TRINITY_DN44338_c0_g1_i1:37-870(+)
MLRRAKNALRGITARIWTSPSHSTSPPPIFLSADVLALVASFLPAGEITDCSRPAGLLVISADVAAVTFTADFWLRLAVQANLASPTDPIADPGARHIFNQYVKTFAGYWVITEQAKKWAETVSPGVVRCTCKSYGSYTVRWNQELERGRSYWRFTAVCVGESSDVFVGLSSPSLDPETFSFGKYMLAGWSYIGGTVTAVPKMSNGDKIGMYVNLDKGEVRFDHNGVPCRSGFYRKGKGETWLAASPLVPVVVFNHKDDCFALEQMPLSAWHAVCKE